MKTIVCIFLLGLGMFVQAQNKYITKTGDLTFEASEPSFEEVKAVNSSTTAILNIENGEFAALALVKGFRFKNALMEEHFNENYAESNTFPKATFKGVVQDFSFENLSTTVSYTVNGTLEFHGVTKKIEGIKVIFSSSEKAIKMSGSFKVLASDFNIKIPKIVSNKLSNEVEVSFEFELIEK